MPPSSMAGGAAPARECTGSFSSVSNNTGEVVVLEEELQLPRRHQLPFHGKAPFMGGPPEMGSVDDDDGDLQHIITGVSSAALPPPAKRKKRCLPGTPDPSAEVVALSPTTLMATNRFVCEICHKGFQRDQNLQLHRRGHNLPWKLRQRGAGEGGAAGSMPRKRVYVCPEVTCVHHNPSRALGDLTGIKKHFCRKHGEKKWKCDRCAKRYAVHSDWKAHSKVCGTREYKCDCGTVFSRRDSFVTHRAFCDALTQENNKLAHPISMATVASALQGGQAHHHHLMPPSLTDDVDMDAEAEADAAAGFVDPDVKIPHLTMFSDENAAAAAGNILLPGSMVSCMLSSLGARNTPAAFNGSAFGKLGLDRPIGSGSTMGFSPAGLASMSATALLQKASLMGATTMSGFGAGFSTTGLRSIMCGFDNLPAVGHFGPTIAHGQYNGHGLFSGSTQLVGFDADDGLLHRPLYWEEAQSAGGTPTAFRSPTSGVNQAEPRRGEDKHVLDFMGVEGQRAFNNVGSFGHHLGPWA